MFFNRLILFVVFFSLTQSLASLRTQEFIPNNSGNLDYDIKVTTKQGLRILKNNGSVGDTGDALVYSSNHVFLGIGQSIILKSISGGYLTYFQVSSRSHVSVFTPSTNYTVSESFSNAFSTAAQPTPTDLAFLDQNPEGVARLFFGEVVPELSFSQEDIYTFYPANEGLSSGEWVHNIGAPLGPNLVLNSNFDTGDSWIKQNNWSISGGAGITTSPLTSLGYLYQPVLAKLEMYISTVDITVLSGLVDHTFGTKFITYSESGTYTAIEKTNNRTFAGVRGRIGFHGQIDNVSYKKIDAAKIIGYTPESRSTFLNTNYGPSNLVYITDHTGRITGISPMNTLSAGDDGRYINFPLSIPVNYSINKSIKQVKGNLQEVLITHLDDSVTVINFLAHNGGPSITVKKDGSGDYTTVAAALANIASGTLENRAVVYIYPGVYDELNLVVPNYTDLIGIGPGVWIKGEQPANASLNNIKNIETINIDETSLLYNLKVTAKNMRYAIHSDSGASTKQAVQYYINCEIEHFGNSDAQAYQDSISGGTVWSQTYAMGVGTHSDEKIYSIGSLWRSTVAAVFIHNNLSFALPSYISFLYSTLENTSGGDALYLRSLGSKQADQVTITSSTLIGDLFQNNNGWKVNPLIDQKANHNEFVTTISNSGIIGQSSVANEPTLELYSIAGSNSSVSISGSGSAILFGTPDLRLGGVGTAARAYSSHSVHPTKVVGTSLNNRLGDKTGSADAINIIFDGTITKTITLNVDFSIMDNDGVLAWLNSQLGESNRGFKVSKPWNGKATVNQN